VGAPKLNKQLQAEVCAYLEKGNTRRASSALVHVDEATFSRWFHRGARDERGPYRDFYLAVLEAEAKCQDQGIETFKLALPRNPKLMLNFLSRRFPADWGRRDNVEQISVEDMATKQQQTRELLLERLEKLLPENDEEAQPAPEGASDD
jgi:hypothetical protein